jgi:hypothetical protein
MATLDHGTVKCAWCRKPFDRRRRMQRFHNSECRALWWQRYNQKARDLLAAQEAGAKAAATG